MKQSYIREIAITLLAAIVAGYAVNALIGVVAFFVVGAFLSKGSVAKEELQKVVESSDPKREPGTIEYAAKDLLTNPIFKD